jgi:hypothetical protein
MHVVQATLADIVLAQGVKLVRPRWELKRSAHAVLAVLLRIKALFHCNRP